VRQQIIGGKVNLQETVYVDRAVDCPSAGGSATITEYGPDTLTITTSGDGGFLTLSDQYYPSWQASLDGQRADIIRADTVFRAVCVPAGDHEVRYEYRPLSVIAGAVISGAAWLVLLIAAILSRGAGT
jgi:uncharacterized membrane protein YfhO